MPGSLARTLCAVAIGALLLALCAALLVSDGHRRRADRAERRVYELQADTLRMGGDLRATVGALGRQSAAVGELQARAREAAARADAAAAEAARLRRRTRTAVGAVLTAHVPGEGTPAACDSAVVWMRDQAASLARDW